MSQRVSCLLTNPAADGIIIILIFEKLCFAERGTDMALFKRAAAAAAAFVIVALLALGSVFAAEQSGLSVGFEFVEGAAS